MTLPAHVTVLPHPSSCRLPNHIISFSLSPIWFSTHAVHPCSLFILLPFPVHDSLFIHPSILPILPSLYPHSPSYTLPCKQPTHHTSTQLLLLRGTWPFSSPLSQFLLTILSLSPSPLLESSTGTSARFPLSPTRVHNPVNCIAITIMQVPCIKKKVGSQSARDWEPVGSVKKIVQPQKLHQNGHWSMMQSLDPSDPVKLADQPLC